MQYVKLTARPDTWFKVGSEVLWQTYLPGTDHKFLKNWTERRPTVEEWEEIKKEGAAGFNGVIVITADDSDRINMGYKPGDKKGDGEWCSVDEFDVEIVEEAN